MTRSEHHPLPARLSLAVGVLTLTREVTSGRWTERRTEATAVVAGEDIGAGESGRTVVADDGGEAQVLHTGLRLTLYRDACESYWVNLQGREPSLFVVAEEDPVDGEVAPVLVTASEDEASAHLESDDPVFRVPMPSSVREQLERFVVTHYRPAEKRKRRRREWAQESDYAKRRPPAG